MHLDVASLIGKRASVGAWSSGHARDSQDTMEFSALRDVTPEIETYDLADVDDASEQKVEKARFRVVLEP